MSEKHPHPVSVHLIQPALHDDIQKPVGIPWFYSTSIHYKEYNTYYKEYNCINSTSVHIIRNIIVGIQHLYIL